MAKIFEHFSKVCPVCGGDGHVDGTTLGRPEGTSFSCKTCQGYGFILEKVEVNKEESNE